MFLHLPPVCINLEDTVKEPMRLEHLLGSGLLIRFFGQCGGAAARLIPH